MTNSKSQVDRGCTSFARVAEDHPLWSEEYLFDALLRTLPQEVVRWHACDVAEHSLAALCKKLNEEPCYFAGNLRAEYRAAIGCMNLARRRVLEPERVSDRSLTACREHLFHLPSGGWWFYLQAAWVTVLQAVERIAGNYRAFGDNGQTVYNPPFNRWALDRLRYLCTVWNMCGERTFWLIQENKCPIPWERDDGQQEG